MPNATGGTRPSAPQKSTPTPMPKVIDSSKTSRRPAPAKSMTPADKAFSDIMKKYNYDPTKIPGWNGGKGTR